MSDLWLLFPFIGPVRITTVVAVIATLVVLTWRRSAAVAVLAVMGWVSGFEIAFTVVDTVNSHRDPHHLFFLTFTFAGWLVAAQLAGVRPLPWLVLLWALVFAAWYATGFSPNYYGTTKHLSASQEIFNVALKDGLAAIYIAGGLWPYRRGPRWPRVLLDKAKRSP